MARGPMWARPRRADDARMRASPATSPATRSPADSPPLGPDSPRTAVLIRAGGWCFDHPWRAIALWLTAVVVVFGVAGSAGPAFSETSDVPDSDSADGVAVLQEHFPGLGTGGRSGTIVFRADQGVDDPEVRAAMENLFASVAAIDDVTAVQSPYDPGGEFQISNRGDTAGQIAYATVYLPEDIDFTRAVRPGDEFRILYERLYFTDDAGHESYLRPGRILAAQYTGAAGAHSAVYYESQPGQGGYYRTDGSSVQRQFLQAPLRFARISSRYSAARHHPILRITRPHQGIDYAAPAGTPIWAVADGKRLGTLSTNPPSQADRLAAAEKVVAELDAVAAKAKG